MQQNSTQETKLSNFQVIHNYVKRYFTPQSIFSVGNINKSTAQTTLDGQGSLILQKLIEHDN